MTPQLPEGFTKILDEDTWLQDLWTGKNEVPNKQAMDLELARHIKESDYRFTYDEVKGILSNYPHGARDRNGNYLDKILRNAGWQQEAKAELINLGSVQSEKVSFLWHPYIPKGKVTILEGDPGLGKSWITLAIATALSLGKGLPGVDQFEPQNILVLNAEDGLADTIKPRLEAMGADSNRVYAFPHVLTFNHQGLEKLEKYVTEIKPGLVSIDPLFAFFGEKRDINQANQTRSVMAALGKIAEKADCSMLAVRHLTKGTRSKSIHRGIGSVDLTAAARSVLLVGADADNQFVRAMVHIKSNLAPMGPAIGYEIREGAFYWTGTSKLTAEQILAPEPTAEERSALDEAVDFLQDLLSGGPVESGIAKQKARNAGVSERSLWRTKKFKTYKEGTKWYWSL